MQQEGSAVAFAGVEVLHRSRRFPNVFEVKQPQMSPWRRITLASQNDDWKGVCAARDEMPLGDLRVHGLWIDAELSRIAIKKGKRAAARKISDSELRRATLLALGIDILPSVKKAA